MEQQIEKLKKEKQISEVNYEKLKSDLQKENAQIQEQLNTEANVNKYKMFLKI